MTAWVIWVILIICAYILGSVPASYLVGRARGIDLRQHGTRQVGGGNLWRTTSRKLGLMVGIFDFIKGMIMVWVAQMQGLDVAQQIVVGAATITGHNWPVFLRFHGGRGVATTLGVVMILPIINHTTPWPAVIAVGIVIIGTPIVRSSPLPVFLGAASLPLSNWALHERIAVIMAFLAIFLILAIKRLTAQPSAEAALISRARLLFNRLLFDRDIRDRKTWMYREPINPQELFDDNE
jgi:glycerol-3-phosphate acyltransferase PlsY